MLHECRKDVKCVKMGTNKKSSISTALEPRYASGIYFVVTGMGTIPAVGTPASSSSFF